MPEVIHNGFTMHYDVQGDGERREHPVLCIMGITAPGKVWAEHAGVWREEFECLLTDNRGAGLTDKPIGPYSSAMMADDHATLLERIGCGKVHVVGCSMGSIIAQQLALRHPDKVRSMVLMCTWARCDRRTQSVFEHMRQVKKVLSPSQFTEWIQHLIFHRRTWDDARQFAGMLESRKAADLDPNGQPAEALEAQAAACVSHDVLDELNRIDVPTLVIGGEDDIFTPRELAEEVHAAIPGSQLHLYPRSGHAFHWENLEDFNTRVLEFLIANDR